MYISRTAHTARPTARAPRRRRSPQQARTAGWSQERQRGGIHFYRRHETIFFNVSLLYCKRPQALGRQPIRPWLAVLYHARVRPYSCTGHGDDSLRRVRPFTRAR